MTMELAKLMPQRYGSTATREVQVYGPLPDPDLLPESESDPYDAILPVDYEGFVGIGDYVVVFPDRKAFGVRSALLERLFAEIPEGQSSRGMWCTPCASNREFDLRDDVLMSRHKKNWRCRVCGYEMPAAEPVAGVGA